MAKTRGGDKAKKAIRELVAALDNPPKLKVGFLENARYPDGTPVAMIAAIQNYGAPRANIPPRPFFSNMIRDKSPEWHNTMLALLKQHNFNVRLVMNLMGEGIKGQVQQAIRDFIGVPLRPRTIARKGHDKQLIDTGHMLNSVDYRIED